MKMPKDTGHRKHFKTGAIREVVPGRGRYDMLLTRGLTRVAKRYELGGIKYKDSDNFLKGMNLRKFVDSAIHHLYQILEGRMDEDHGGAAAWNVLAMMETQERIREGLLPAELDDLPKLPIKRKVKNDDTQKTKRRTGTKKSGTRNSKTGSSKTRNCKTSTSRKNKNKKRKHI